MLDIDSCTDVPTASFPQVEIQKDLTKTEKAPTISKIQDQMISLADREITGCELYAKSAVALTLGIVPFAVSKLGQAFVKGCAFLAQEAESALHKLGFFGDILGKALRMVIGIPASLSGVLLFGGAWLFAQTQKIAWGKQLVEHPQEEKTNTQLARYGAKGTLFQDFSQIVTVFFNPKKDISLLTKIRQFSIQ